MARRSDSTYLASVDCTDTAGDTEGEPGWESARRRASTLSSKASHLPSRARKSSFGGFPTLAPTVRNWGEHMTLVWFS